MFGAGRNRGAIARKLGEKFHVFLVDLPNHGDSPWVETLDYESMALSVVDFVRARGIFGDAALLGHSMGGKVGMTLALRESKALARLIVVDIAPVTYHSHSNDEIIDALLALPLDVLKSRGEIDAALAPRIADPMLRSYLLANLRREGNRFVWRINLAGLRTSLPTLLDFPRFDAGVHYDAPTFFIEGARSAYIRAEDRPVIRARFPRARIEIVPEAGHWVHADAPDAVTALVAGFMSE